LKPTSGIVELKFVLRVAWYAPEGGEPDAEDVQTILEGEGVEHLEDLVEWSFHALRPLESRFGPEEGVYGPPGEAPAMNVGEADEHHAEMAPESCPDTLPLFGGA